MQLIKEQKERVKKMSDSELAGYIKHLQEASSETKEEIESLKEEFDRFGLKANFCLTEKQFFIEYNGFIIALAKEELTNRKSNNVLLSISTLEVFNSEDNEPSVTDPKIGNVRILTVEQEAGSGATIQAFHEVNSSDLDKEIKKIKRMYGK